jgi:hypothetical protein
MEMINGHAGKLVGGLCFKSQFSENPETRQLGQQDSFLTKKEGGRSY